MKKTLIALSLAAMTLPAIAAEPDYEISGNFALTSDYRFRGVSQSNLKPAVQGGIDFSHKSGFYAGNWNSSVSEWTAPNGGGIEMDFYAGYTTEVSGIGVDLGAIYYYYPGAKLEPDVWNTNYYNTQELYVGLSYGPVSFKTSYTLSKRYFSLGKSTVDDINAVLEDEDDLDTDIYNFSGSAKGTLYFDLTYELEIAPKTTMSFHAGYLDFKNARRWNIKDYSVGLAHDLGDDWSLGLSVYKTDLGSNAKDSEFFVDSNGKKLSKTGAALSISKSF